MLPEPAERNHVDGNQLAAHSQMRIGDTITNIYHLPNGRESYIKAHAVLHQEKPRQYQKKQVWCIVVGAVILVAGMAVAIALPLVRSSQSPSNPTPAVWSSMIPSPPAGVPTSTPTDSTSTLPSSTTVDNPISSPIAATTPTSTPTGSSRRITSATNDRGQLVRGLAPGEKCTADSECLAPNFCYTEAHSPTSATCCGPGNWGCPGASCGSHNDCLDPFPCHTPAPGSGATCCGYPPWTVYRGANCWSTDPATMTKAG